MSVNVGQTVTFQVTITNLTTLPILYRWRKGFVTLDMQMLNDYRSTFTISNVQPADAGGYSVVVTNNVFFTPEFVSNPAILEVIPATPMP